MSCISQKFLLKINPRFLETSLNKISNIVFILRQKKISDISHALKGDLFQLQCTQDASESKKFRMLIDKQYLNDI